MFFYIERRRTWKGGVFYDTLGSEVPKIAFSQLWPQLLMDRTDFWHGDSFLVELHLKLAIFPSSAAVAACAAVMSKVEKNL